MKRSILFTFLSALLFCGTQVSAQDFDHDNLGDLALYDPSRAVFLTRFSSGANVQQSHLLGGTGDLPLHGDFLGTGTSGLATFDRTTGRWEFFRSDLTSGELTFFGSKGDLPVMGNFRGAACEEFGTYTIRDATWTISNCTTPTTSTVTFGDSGAIPVTGDWDGDGAAELGTFNRSNARWIVGGNLTGGSIPGSGQTFNFGLAGDIPVPADYDGDGDFDAAVYRPSEGRFYVRDANTGDSLPPVAYGLGGDVPLAYDIGANGPAGTADMSVYRPTNNRYYVRVSSSLSFNDISLSNAKATESDPLSTAPAPSIALPLSLNPYAFGVVPGDLNRNLRSDFIFVKDVSGLNEFNSLDPDGTISSMRFGFPTDKILMGDTDGDLRFEPIVVRTPTSGLLDWYSRSTSAVAINTKFGEIGDTPLVGDLDCDGKDDLAVVRKRDGGYDWYVRKSTGGISGPIQFGLETDSPYIADTNGDGCEDMVVAQNVVGGIFWFTKDFSTGVVTNLQWGLQASDKAMPPMDFDGDGADDFNIVRTSGTQQTAYIRLANGTAKTLSVGDTTQVPFVGHFSGLTNAEYATYDASSGLSKIRRLNGVNTDVKMTVNAGATKIMSPYGIPITIQATGGSGGGGNPPPTPGTLTCTSTRSVDGIGNGFVWKPISASDGKLVIVYEYGKTFLTSDLYTPEGVFIERGRYDGQLNGGRSHQRFRRTGGSLPNGVIAQDSSGRCIVVNNPGSRHG